MSHGASPSPWWTLNAISPTAVRLVFGAEAAAAPMTSASVDTTATKSRKLPKMSTGPLCALTVAVPRQPALGRANVHIRRRGRHGGRGSQTQRIETRLLASHHGREAAGLARRERERRD